MHLNIFNRGASSKVTIILDVSINKIAILGAKNSRLLNLERIVAPSSPAWRGQTVGPRSNVRVSLESLGNGLSYSQSGKMV